MRLKYTQRPPVVQLSMTSMIDVIFLLLIFFVCTANLERIEALLKTELASSGVTGSVAVTQPEVLRLDHARVTISYENGQVAWQVEGHHCRSLQDLQAVLVQIARAKDDFPVMISCDENVPVESWLDVIDACRQVGLTNISFELISEP
ncbi:MAG: biopolymer transporter ExbD [Planctomycetaceae bacterium]|nr:biopolymer transporter ExbD [Planctomycetaceae bacterium]